MGDEGGPHVSERMLVKKARPDSMPNIMDMLSVNVQFHGLPLVTLVGEGGTPGSSGADQSFHAEMFSVIQRSMRAMYSGASHAAVTTRSHGHDYSVFCDTDID